MVSYIGEIGISFSRRYKLLREEKYKHRRRHLDADGAIFHLASEFPVRHGLGRFTTS